MIFNLSESAGKLLPHYDVCIIGSGPAGLIVANELPSTLRVCVLESGSLEKTRFADGLRDTRSEGGYRIKTESRERVLGGASSTWSGLSGKFEPIDLEKRSWVPYSGWPITFEELESYYDLAAARYAFPPTSCFTRDL